MNQYKVTFKRTEVFYETVLVNGTTEDEARATADKMSEDGEICFDYFKESDVLEEHIVDIEKI